MTEFSGEEHEIVFERVSLRFEDHQVLRDVSFQLERGETKIVIGASGVGKSVLLKLTLGLLQPDSGRIIVFGQDITGLDEEDLFPIRQRIGMVFQEGALFDSLTVAENVGYVFGRMPEVRPEEADRRVREALCFVELEHTLDMLPGALSGGMRRRVAIARAIVGEPELVLLDSPTAGLDPITAQRIVSLVIKQRDVRAVSSLLVTHRLQDAYQMASLRYDGAKGRFVPMSTGNGDGAEVKTRFLLMREGEVAFHGSLQEITAREDPYIRKFLA